MDQVTSLQHATVNEAQVKVAANLQYQIENTGLKSFRVFLATNAEGVTFHGDQLADFLAADGVVTNGLQAWDIKLHRRVIGQYLLQVNYQIPNPSQSGETVLRGVLAADVNLQRGFATVRIRRPPPIARGRSAGLAPADRMAGHSARLAKGSVRRVGEFRVPPCRARFSTAAQAGAARRRQIAGRACQRHHLHLGDLRRGRDADAGKLDILPGDKRLLNLTLPRGASFWFAFVNQNGVWPWREGEQNLIPLEQQSRGDQPVPVEIYFSCDAGKSGGGALDLNLLAPKFDLPLENLTWRVFLNDKWQVKKWSGALQLQQQEIVANGLLDVPGYLQNELSLETIQDPAGGADAGGREHRAAKRRPATGAARLRVRLRLIRE